LALIWWLGDVKVACRTCNPDTAFTRLSKHRADIEQTFAPCLLDVCSSSQLDQ